MDKEYRWTKVWAIQTSDDDTVQVGDIIQVGGSKPSDQQVLSVTTLWNVKGNPYKTLLTTEVK